MSLIQRIQSLTSPNNQSDVNLVSEIAYNTLYGTVNTLTADDITFFKKYKSQLRILASKVPWQRRKSVISKELLERLKIVALNYLNGSEI